MSYKNAKVVATAEVLKKKLKTLDNKASILRAPELKALFDEIKLLKPAERAEFGREVNELKKELQALASEQKAEGIGQRQPIDVTAPFDVNAGDRKPRLLPNEVGTQHPVMSELETMLDIFYRMGFDTVESRQIDDDYHMFGSLNFPIGHPARDDYDSFITKDGLIAPAHTSTMQNRVLKKYKDNLQNGRPIAVVIPGRTFRNEDVDARHEHTFHQLEGVYVAKGVNVGHLMATLKTFLQEYYQQELQVKTQPFYFPFTEPSFEFVSSCPFCAKKGCNICSYTGWLELLGCGLIHPNVLKEASIDPAVYSGFAWGMGIERPVMIKYGIEDIRHFNSGKLDFLRQFTS